MNRSFPFAAALRGAARVVVLAAGLIAAGLPAAAQTAASAPAAAASGPTVRPESAKLLQAAQDLIRDNQHKEALAKVAEAEALPNPAPYETYLMQRIKAVASVGAGDPATAISMFERVMASDQLPAADRAPISETLAKLAIQSKDYPRAVRWIRANREAGGNDAGLLRLLPQLLAETGDHAGAVAEVAQIVKADDGAGRATPENLLRVMAFSQNKISDEAGYLKTLERLTARYPNADYWNELIAREVRGKGFAYDRFALDVYRLRRAVGLMLPADELADFAQRAQQAGLPGEAQKLVDEGYAAGLLGKGAEAAAHQKLREQVAKALAADRAALADGERAALAAKDGNALVNLGLAVSGNGDHAKAATLMEQGIAKGGLRRPDEAWLHLALVQWRAGRNDAALKSLAQANGTDGSATLAQLWALHLKAPAKK